MKLVHEVLDAQLLDRGDRKIGRIDTIVLALADDGPPRVVAVECGPVALAGRVHPRLAERLARWLRRRGSVLATPVRLDWATLRRVRNDFVAETVDAATTPIVAGERWTRDRVIGRIPGA